LPNFANSIYTELTSASAQSDIEELPAHFAFGGKAEIVIGVRRVRK
jgi:hypothetical protein